MAKNYCLDCRGWIPGSKMFMVKNALWERYGAGKKHLCLSCFGLRLNRGLEAVDFQECIANRINKEVAILFKDNRL